MMHLRLRPWLWLFIILTLGVGHWPSAYAADPMAVTFTLTAKSVFLRNAPSFTAARVYSVFKGQTYNVLGRTGDNEWLKLDFAGATTETWIWRGYGTFNGNLGVVSVFPYPSSPAPVSGATPASGGATSSNRTFVYFTLTVKSTFLRDAPNGNRVYSIFKGQRFEVLNKNADGTWLRLDYAGAATEAWVLAANGTLAGNLANVPLAGTVASVGPAPSPTQAASPGGGVALPAGVLPTASARAREVYQHGLALGNNPRAFAKVGDCMSVNPYFLTSFDNAADYRLGANYAYLQEAITNFSGSFSRESQAARIGFSTLSVLDPLWANPKFCASGESPLACELRLKRPSIIFVSLGTNGEWLTDADYEASLRRILDEALARGALPLLSTKADDLEGGGRFNAIVRKLAGEYQLPLWDWRLAADALPNRGIASNSAYQLTWGQAFYDGPASTWTGWQWRNLTALQALEAVWKAVK